MAPPNENRPQTHATNRAPPSTSSSKSHRPAPKATAARTSPQSFANSQELLTAVSGSVGVTRRALLSTAELTLPIPSKHFYCPPKQRQRWREAEEHPHVNWGDLFFDLFYVGAAYNLASILKYALSAEGALYFFGCYGPVYLFWFNKMLYDSRFSVDDDPVHRTFEVIELGFLATAVLHIRPVELMSNPYDNNDMFAFSLAALLGSFWNILRYLEVSFLVVGERAAKKTARYEVVGAMLATTWFLIATVVSGLAYFGSSHDNDHRELAAGDDEKYSNYEGSNERTTNIPIYMCLAGWMSFLVWLFLLISRVPEGGEIEKVTVPMNLAFVIHRYGEWTMLMLGESVLSLLIVDVSEGADYYLTFYAGVLSVIMLQYLHFRSQPHHPEDHAIRRNKIAGYLFVVMMQLYSAALIVLGASYKMLLTEYTYKAGDDHRLLRTAHSFPEDVMRLLAGADGSSKLSEEERKEVIAQFFCASMAIVFACLDLMALCHKGLVSNLERSKGDFSKILAALLTALRVGLVLFIATLSEYVTTPEILAVIGLACVFGQVWIRSVGCKIFPDDQIHVEDKHHNGGMGASDTHNDVEEQMA